MPDKFVLIIEDDPVNAKLLAAILLDYTPRFYSESADRISLALSLLRDNPGKFTLVLLDLTVLDSRNLQGLKEIKKHFPGIPVIIVSALFNHEIEAEAEDEGAIFYIHKPFASIAATHAIITRMYNIWWTQYAFCRLAWELEHKEKLTQAIITAALPEDAKATRYKLWTGVAAAVVAVFTAIATFWKEVVDVVQKMRGK